MQSSNCKNFLWVLSFVIVKLRNPTLWSTTLNIISGRPKLSISVSSGKQTIIYLDNVHLTRENLCIASCRMITTWANIINFMGWPSFLIYSEFLPTPHQLKCPSSKTMHKTMLVLCWDSELRCQSLFMSPWPSTLRPSGLQGTDAKLKTFLLNLPCDISKNI